MRSRLRVVFDLPLAGGSGRLELVFDLHMGGGCEELVPRGPGVHEKLNLSSKSAMISGGHPESITSRANLWRSSSTASSAADREGLIVLSVGLNDGYLEHELLMVDTGETPRGFPFRPKMELETAICVFLIALTRLGTWS